MTTITDSFKRTLNGTLGISDSGDAWTYNGNSSALSLDGTKCIISAASGQTDVATIGSGLSDGEAYVDFALPQTPAGTSSDSISLAVAGCVQDTNNMYLARMNWAVGSSPTISTGIRVNGSLTVYGQPATWPAAWNPGDIWRLLLHVESNADGSVDVFCKAWRPATDPVPASWTATGNDLFRTFTGGSWGFRAYTSNTLSNNPQVFDLYGFSFNSLTPAAAPGEDLSSNTGCMFGIRSIPTGSVTPENDFVNTIVAREKLLGRKADFIMTFRNWDPATENTNSEALAISGGRIPMISWPLGTNTPADANTGISSGTYDSIVYGWGKLMQQLGGRVFFRFAWEMNGDPDFGPAPSTFTSTWQRIWTIIKGTPAQYAALSPACTQGPALQAGNVEFVWAVNHRTTSTGGDHLWDEYYPGNDYVDWIAIDSYNKNPATQLIGTLVTSGDFLSLNSNHNWYEIYRGRRQSNGKSIPLMIAETGCREADDPGITGTAQPWSKASWIADAQSSLKNYPAIKAFLYFDVNAPAGDYRIDTMAGSYGTPNDNPATNPTLSAFKTFVNDSYFNRRVLVQESGSQLLFNDDSPL